MPKNLLKDDTSVKNSAIALIIPLIFYNFSALGTQETHQ